MSYNWIFGVDNLIISSCPSQLHGTVNFQQSTWSRISLQEYGYSSVSVWVLKFCKGGVWCTILKNKEAQLRNSTYF